MQRGRTGSLAAAVDQTTETWPANWKLLEDRIGRRCGEFMWMFRRGGLEYYKHVDTRRYLVLDGERELLSPERR